MSDMKTHGNCTMSIPQINSTLCYCTKERKHKIPDGYGCKLHAKGVLKYAEKVSALVGVRPETR